MLEGALTGPYTTGGGVEFEFVHESGQVVVGPACWEGYFLSARVMTDKKAVSILRAARRNFTSSILSSVW